MSYSMRRYVVLSALLAAAVAVPSLAHEGKAQPGTLDGKGRKSWAFKADVRDPQIHVLAETVANPVDAEVTTECVAPRCHAFPFTVKPARGVSTSTPLSIRVGWTLPTSRFWLHLVDLNKRAPFSRAFCGTFYVTGGTSATVRMNSLKPGKYAAWVTVQQLVAPDTITGTVTYPAKHKPAANPGPFPTDLFVNGCNA